MEISRSIQIATIGLGGLAIAFLAGYIIFSYFSGDNSQDPQLAEEEQTAPVETEDQAEEESVSEGIVQHGSVAGTSDSSGISPTSQAGSNNELKGGVLGESDMQTGTGIDTTPDHDGITPTSAQPDRNTITEEDRQQYREDKKKEETRVDTSNSEVYVYQTPDIEEEDDYVRYTYTFEFNDDAQIRYKDGFDYTIGDQSCDESEYFTDEDYDFEGTVSGVDDEVEIEIRINDEYLDDIHDFDDSDYELNGKYFVVKGELNVPHCTN